MQKRQDKKKEHLMLENCSDAAFDISVNCRCLFVFVRCEPHPLGGHSRVEETRTNTALKPWQ